MLTYCWSCNEFQQQYEREPIVSPNLLVPPSSTNLIQCLTLGISEWMGDTNVESDDTKFLDSIVFDDN